MLCILLKFEILFLFYHLLKDIIEYKTIQYNTIEKKRTLWQQKRIQCNTIQ